MRWLPTLALISLLGCGGADAHAAPSARQVVQTWSDGLSEVAVYDAELVRYGERRGYKEVQILVKEPFDARRMVKTDRPGSSPEHEFTVLKSIRQLSFVTGIYDYHQSLAYFAPMLRGPLEGSPLGKVEPLVALGERPAKLTLSSFEWCGSFFAEWLGSDGKLSERSFSYFDGEANGERTLTTPAAWLAEDGWPVWSRGLAGYGAAESGARLPVRVLTSTLQARFEHKPVRWVDGYVQVRRGGDRDVVTLELKGERTWTIEVDRSPWRRVVSWQTTHGWRGTLTKVERLPYWSQNRVNDEPLRKELGL